MGKAAVRIGPRQGEEEATFVQISDGLMIDRGDGRWIDQYYSDAYEKMPGYRKPEHFMELPTWIPVISGMMDDRYSQEVHIVTDVDESAEALAGGSGVLLFSTIEANSADTKELLSKIPHRRVLMGGHVDPAEFADLPNVTFLESPAELAHHLPGLDTTAPPNNELFRGAEVIPRLTLSTGCLHLCEFCMVPRRITTMSTDNVNEQVDGFEPLNFELVYLDDKTFSQAPNWRTLAEVRDRIRGYNPSFKGFIVQTTTRAAATPGRLEEFEDIGIKYAEIGVESVNPDTLLKLKKPYRLSHLDAATDAARRLGMPLIPNFIFGIPEDDPDAMVSWTAEHQDIIPVVNVNFLSVLYGAMQERPQEHLPKAEQPADLDQNAYDKTWLGHEEKIRMLQAVRAIFHLNTGGDYFPDTYASDMTHITAEETVAAAIRRSPQRKTVDA